MINNNLFYIALLNSYINDELKILNSNFIFQGIISK